MAFSCYLSKLLSILPLVISEKHIIGHHLNFEEHFNINFIGEGEVLLQID